VQREFRRKFGDDRQHGAAPSRIIIGQWVRQWRETGSYRLKPKPAKLRPVT
jgi:transposase